MANKQKGGMRRLSGCVALLATCVASAVGLHAVAATQFAIGSRVVATAEPPVAQHDRPTHDPEDAAGQARPQPVAVVMAVEPVVERQQHQERGEEQPGAHRDDATRVHLHRGWLDELATGHDHSVETPMVISIIR